ncbi:MAG TPA: GTP diphosphokinase [Gammaproteobacteria bacterium]|nr:GTP diphosphokinase [Gammaproteobacteria bacterium]HBF10058.1 GTP diphosphokinase [Gammaproteobacteria bacterium]HCK94600.1 GTP diphosphokinase [Gammaproteobacteria bacterium]
MVKVREDLPRTAEGDFDQDVWLRQIQVTAKLESTSILQHACEKISQLKLSERINRTGWQGMNCIDAGLKIVQILAELRLDEQALAAALLYRAVREERITIETIEEEFGDTVAKLIDGVLRMAAISAYVHPRSDQLMGLNDDLETKRPADPVLGKRVNQVHNLRKMLVAMVDDVRVALIKLAERTCAIRALKGAPREKQERVSREIFDIYAPLAHRLGIGHLKWELEDLSFRYLKPDEYKNIAKQLDERRLDRQEYIDNLVSDLKGLLSDARIEAEVVGRAKHIYSIWRKMHRKHLPFHQIYDIRAVRVLVPEVKDCYSTLGLVHAQWRHIPKEFDDYIATPKENGYKSLHTAVLGPGGRVIEVQIRTFEMHDEAELGVCAHYLYKEGGGGQKNSQAKYDDKILWLRQVLEWHESLGEADADNFLAHISSEAVDDRVYVFTRDGHVVDLATGATPLDFAYHVHTEVGHRCRGAKINGRIVPLGYKLHTGEQVEILTGKGSSPSRDWLNPHLGYITSAKARAKIQHWFKMQDRDVHLKDGRAILERELDRVNMKHVNLQKVAAELNLKTAEDLYVAIARGDMRLGRVLQAVQVTEPFVPKTDFIEISEAQPQTDRTQGLEVEGVTDLLSQTAGCCKPLPGDAVMGYISIGRGVIVHKKDCPELARLADREPVRIIPVDWSGADDQGYPVDLLIQAYDRKGLLKDISLLMADAGVNVLNFNTNTDKRSNFASMRVTAEVEGLAQLGRVITKLAQLPNVVTVKRC